MHTVGGSIASSFAGEPRSTVDIDIVAAIEDVAPLLIGGRDCGSAAASVDAAAVRIRARREQRGAIHRVESIRATAEFAAHLDVAAR